MREIYLATVDLVIRNGKIVTPSGIFEAGIGVDDGKIAVIAKDINLPKADLNIDVEGNFVLPGLIDAHVHFRDPGTTYREDFETGTKAAAAGGVTTIFEMPISTPAVSSVEIFERRKGIAKDKSVVDFALYGGAGDNIEEIQKIANVGAIGFKTFLHELPKGREIEFRGMCVTDNGSLFNVFKTIAQTGLPSVVHAEDNTIIEHLAEKLKKAGRKDPMAHVESRPNFAESLAIASTIILSDAAGARLHIAHMSTREGAQLVGQAKASNKRVTAETTIQHLVLNLEAMRKLGPYAKINPPLRSFEDSQELWNGLNDGTIDFVTSDHSPYTKEEKDEGWNDIWKAPAGAPQIETMLPLLLTQVNRGRITIERLTKVTSESVAKVFGLYPKKGAILVGSDADFAIINLKKEKTISPEQMYSKARDIILYDGWNVKGFPIVTTVRGHVVMEHGEVIGKPGCGAFIKPLKLHSSQSD